jgi:hypothetical protein
MKFALRNLVFPLNLVLSDRSGVRFVDCCREAVSEDAALIPVGFSADGQLDFHIL